MTGDKSAFRSQPKLTYWVSLLGWSKIAAAGVVIVIYIILMLGLVPENETGLIIMAPAALCMPLYATLYLVGGVISLIWIYGAARNARVLRPEGFNTSPAWAVGWFFVPIANLFKPLSVLSDIWVASKGPENNVYPDAPHRLGWWWWLGLLGGILMRVTERAGAFGDEEAFFKIGGLEYAFLTGMVLACISTALFIITIRDIQRLQVQNDRSAAEVF